uniref:Uncharacterized protein n=1 Tax=Rhizophora mucronata TaxID=61149 RepID=A0A2P2PSR6_RHIMU
MSSQKLFEAISELLLNKRDYTF